MQDVAQRAHSIWRGLKAQFRWSFVHDDEEAAFVDTIVQELSTRPDSANLSDAEINASIQQRYNRRMYEAFVAGLHDLADQAAVEATQRAAEEIRLIALRQIRAKGYEQDLAEDLAQQVLVRLIEKPYAIREPGCLPVYIRFQIRDLLKAFNRRPAALSIDVDDGSEHPLAGSHNPTQQVDDKLLAQELASELPTFLSDFQLRVIQLVVLEEYSAIDAADKLDVKA
ncbi:MAG: sigma-70 family RNA polymerase sigma factor, partial [Chloroflexi bacterium]|nr:sigma-70 family RNA polymerase sigma factor [Chloroflexota bacterium]